MKQSLEKLVGGRGVSALGAAPAQAAGGAETEIEVGVRIRAKRAMLIFTTVKVEAGVATVGEIEPVAVPDRVVDRVEAGVPTEAFGEW